MASAGGPPRSLLLSANFPPARGGTCRWFWELYRRLPRRARVAAAAQPGDRQFDARHRAAVVRMDLDFRDWSLLGGDGLGRYRRAGRALRRELRREPARALHAGRLLPEGWLARRAALPFACYVHGEELNTISTSRQLVWMARRVLDRADLLIANSANTAARLRDAWRVPDDRVEILHPGVDTAHFHPAPPDRAARAELGWSDGAVLLTVARLQERKGHDRMLAALPSLLDAQANLLWAVVGDGALRPALERRAAEMGLARAVRFHGEIDDRRLALAYQQCDLFVLPNREASGDFEGFGMVLLEAQACARAVVAGTSGGTREAMRSDQTGRLVDASNPAALAAAIGELLADPERRRAMGERGREWALRFDWDRCAGAARELWDRRGV